MDFALSERETQWRDRVRAFMTAHVYPAVAAYQTQMAVEGVLSGATATRLRQGAMTPTHAWL